MLQIEKTVCADAYLGTNNQWLYQGFSTVQWLDMAEGHRHARRLNEADEAYIISSRLQGMDNNDL